MTTSSLLTAQEVAELLGWKVNTVYRNRSRSLGKISRGLRLQVSDFPTGSDPDAGRLLWRKEEVTRYRDNRKRSAGAPGHVAPDTN